MTRTASFDRLAPVYGLLERAAFGGRLEQARSFPLQELTAALRRALLVGDGDGRFCLELLRRFPDAQVEAVDSSEAMLRRLRTRVARGGVASERVACIRGDATALAYPEGRYDFLGLNFALDCFSSAAVAGLLPRLEAALAPGGHIGYADFAIPEGASAWRRMLAQAVVGGLYGFFRVAAGVEARRLPEVAWSRAATVAARRTWLGGMVASELRRAGPPAPESACRFALATSC